MVNSPSIKNKETMGDTFHYSEKDALYHVSFTFDGGLAKGLGKPFFDCMADAVKFCAEKDGRTLLAYVILNDKVDLVFNFEDMVATFKIASEFTGYVQTHLKPLVKALPEPPQASRFHNNLQALDVYEVPKLIDWMHREPVIQGLCAQKEDYAYSSAKNYAGEKGRLEVAVLAS